MPMDYFNCGDNVPQNPLNLRCYFLRMFELDFSNRQHVCEPCSMFRNLLAVALIFFVLMDPSLLVFDTSALYCQDEPVLP
jgi:hypothetical protein